MQADGTPVTIKGPELDDMLGRGFMSLLGASFLMQPGLVGSALTNSITGPGMSFAPSLTGSSVSGGFNAIFGNVENSVSGLAGMARGIMPFIGEMSAFNAITSMVSPQAQAPQSRTPQGLQGPGSPFQT